MELPGRLDLARTPTPLEFLPRLTDAWGGPRLWVKRDDLTGFGLSGNKVRKLEFHLSAALDAGADTVVTTGAVQSNHCRATALAAARLGLRCVLVLRTDDGEPPDEVTGNHRLQQLAGARISFVDPDAYTCRDEIMAEIAARELADGHRTWVIPEGASDALGMLGMASGFTELAADLGALDGRPVAALWHAASSGGTTAGFGWAAARTGPNLPIVAVSVGHPAPVLDTAVRGLWADGAARFGGPMPDVAIEYRDDFVGEGYGRIDPDQVPVVERATRLTGMLFDPSYTGKVMYALYQEVRSGRFTADDNVIFWHTGGGFEALR